MTSGSCVAPAWLKLLLLCGYVNRSKDLFIIIDVLDRDQSFDQ